MRFYTEEILRGLPDFLKRIPKDVQEFVECVERGEIPPVSPKRFTQHSFLRPFSGAIGMTLARDRCLAKEMWSAVDLKWTKELAAWIGKRQVLEVMAGVGWLAKALAIHGVEIIATDSYLTMDHYIKEKIKPPKMIYPVLRMDAVAAVKHYKAAEILLISWPPYESRAICRAAKAWGSERPIIYIGEHYGCNAPSAFSDRFFSLVDHPSFSFGTWDFIRDEVSIGHYELLPKDLMCQRIADSTGKRCKNAGYKKIGSAIYCYVHYKNKKGGTCPVS